MNLCDCSSAAAAKQHPNHLQMSAFRLHGIILPQNTQISLVDPCKHLRRVRARIAKKNVGGWKSHKRWIENVCVCLCVYGGISYEIKLIPRIPESHNTHQWKRDLQLLLPSIIIIIICIGVKCNFEQPMHALTDLCGYLWQKPVGKMR